MTVSAIPSQTATPSKTISLEDFADQAKEEGCIIVNNDKGTFIGEPGTSTGLAYPHVHVWTNGTIALSVGASKNQKIGKNEVIDISELNFAYGRFSVPTGKLNNTIRWVLSSAS
jgi:hypothetical protein